MKVFAILSLAAMAMAGAVEMRDGCHGNNCNRAVTGTGGHLLPSATRKADCSSFQATTVTPDAVTTTVTVTVDADEPAKFKRNVQPLEQRDEKVIPTYIKNCASPEDYAAACSCWGITATTSTAPTPTSTVTSTVTEDYCEDL
jgi:hypothetical protein